MSRLTAVAIPSRSRAEQAPSAGSPVGRRDRRRSAKRCFASLATRDWGVALSPSDGRPDKRRDVAILVFLGLLALAVYLPHVVRGGWYLDDWILVAELDDAFATGGLTNVFAHANDISYRPGYAVLLTGMFSVSGDGQSPYLALGTAITALQGGLFFVVLRLARLRALVAGAAAALLIVLPYIDSSRLWMAAFPLNAAVGLYLAGLALALIGLRKQSSRWRLAFHAGAVLVFAVAVLTYELVAPLPVVSVLIYWAAHDRRPALRRWPFDLASVAIGLAVVAPRAQERRGGDISVDHMLDRVGEMAEPAKRVFLEHVPLADLLHGPVGAVLVVAAAVGIGMALGRGDGLSRPIRAWASIGALGLVFSLAGLVMLLPADSYFVPRPSGIGDRASTAAAPGSVLLLLSLVVLTCYGLAYLVRRARWAGAIATVAVVITVVDLGIREVHHQDAWAKSWRETQNIVAAVKASVVPPPPKGSGVVTFRHLTFILPSDVTTFATSWDLRGALWQLYDDPTVKAHPYTKGMVCSSGGVAVPGSQGFPSPDRRDLMAYGDLWFVDVPTRAAVQIPDAATCRDRIAQMQF